MSLAALYNYFSGSLKGEIDLSKAFATMDSPNVGGGAPIDGAWPMIVRQLNVDESALRNTSADVGLLF